MFGSTRSLRPNEKCLVPSFSGRLSRWLGRVGFESIECLDVSVTTNDEQRKTDWMQFESFEHAIDPDNDDLTIEGLQRPTRAALRARLPQT